MTTNTPSSGPSRPTHSIAPAATALAVLASAGSAAAQVTFFNTPATVTPGNTLYVDIDGGTTSTTNGPGWEFAFSFYGAPANPADPRLYGYSPKAAVTAVKPYASPYGFVAKLGPNALIDGSNFAPAPDKPMVHGQYGYNGPWAGGANGYIGFGWMPGGTPRYGWMDVTYDTSGGGSLTLNSWFYDPNGNFVQAGSLVPVAVPEPATTTAVMGAAILAGSAVMMRRRREKLAAAAA